VVDRIHAWLPARLRARHAWRTVIVLATFLLTIALLIGGLAFVVPPISTEVGMLVQHLPELGRSVYSATPQVVQQALDGYNRFVPSDIRAAVQRYLENLVPTLLNTMQKGVSKTVGIALSTLSFILSLLAIPLWMFYILRDHPQIMATLYTLLPPDYREDLHSILTIIDSVLGAYLRGQFILCLSVGLMNAVGMAVLHVDFALLLGALAGIFEIVPTLGPILGAIPAILVTLATNPAQVPWVMLLALSVQQIENAFLVPQVTGMTVRLHPALIMLVLVMGAEIAGAAGVILSVPLTAVARDLIHYLSLRLGQRPASPGEALARVLPNH